MVRLFHDGQSHQSFDGKYKFRFRMKFKTVWLWPLIDTLNSSIDWDNLRERLSVTTTVHDVPTIDI